MESASQKWWGNVYTVRPGEERMWTWGMVNSTKGRYVSLQVNSMVTQSLGSDKVETSREAGLSIRSGKPRSRSRGPELLDLVRVEGGRG